MARRTIRISDTTHAALRALARAEGRTMASIVEEAVEILRREHLLRDVNDAYSTLRSDEAAWAAVEVERAAWDATLLDGLSGPDERP